jgi:2-dehydro-3-deoxyphosphogluconate aldolase/(4S)-4-hydroxy-2-oxoglutarate aldolase
MKRLTNKQVYAAIERHRFIPLFSHDDPAVCRQVVRAAYEGGVRLFEYTNRSPNALKTFGALSEFCQAQFPDLVLGAGTIMNKRDAKAFYKEGAQFIVAPVINTAVGDYCADNDVLWCPGASTLNEIINAHNAGADLVKLFPGNYMGGPGYLEALRGPCPYIKILVTGGVDGSEENIHAWFRAGAVAVGMGSNFFLKEAIAQNDYGKITELAARVTSIAAGAAAAAPIQAPSTEQPA